MNVARTWTTLAGHDIFEVSVGGRIASDADLAPLYAAALAEIDGCGLAAPQTARNRIWTRDADIRRRASDARLIAFSGERRGASASFMAPERLPEGVDVIVDVLAVGGAAPKRVVEYEPRIAPPRFVAFGDLIFLSGNTDISERFGAQLDVICRNIGASLAIAGARWRDIARVEVFHARRLEDFARVRAGVSARFPVAPRFTTVEGYSAPEKLVEIEVTAMRR
jgi:enamine deaminase RidA (YjgF/YER057c/UK114 family)